MRTEPNGAAQGGAVQARPLAIYLHIPFCVKKCAYCDFLSFPRNAAAGGGETRRRYFDALLSEIGAAAENMPTGAYEVQSVYFGGGTPSLAGAEDIAALLDRLAARFAIAPGAEISLECNPGTADAGKLRELRRAGINRLSIGVQSFDDAALRLLGRIHTAADAVRCFADARSAGFDNVSLDLMAALPGQTEDALLAAVRRAAALAPEHISLYSLIIEEGTPFYARYADETEDPHFDRPVRKKCAGGRDVRAEERRKEARGTEGGANAALEERADAPALPGEEAERAMLHAAWTMLAETGYARYEISNFAREDGAAAGGGEDARRDHRCRHNLTYWTRGDYLGLGLGAASLLDNVRFFDTRDMAKYLSAFADAEGAGDLLARLREDTEPLSVQAQMEEFMFLGLRLTEGVRERRFAEVFHREIGGVYGGVIERNIADGLLARRDGRLFLTGRGTDIANYVMAQFLF